ncbi:hypothetical protein VH569_13150 [Azospirillum sp. 11R-A]|uniref:hypothetical protein n=1 Tax=Azospirillum sp. 11R-A TaxID=3111634 RepID=UPI003C1AF552
MDPTDTGRGGRYHLDATGAVIRADAVPATETPLPPDPDSKRPAGRRRPSTSVSTTDTQE